MTIWMALCQFKYLFQIGGGSLLAKKYDKLITWRRSLSSKKPQIIVKSTSNWCRGKEPCRRVGLARSSVVISCEASHLHRWTLTPRKMGLSKTRIRVHFVTSTIYKSLHICTFGIYGKVDYLLECQKEVTCIWTNRKWVKETMCKRHHHDIYSLVKE